MSDSVDQDPLALETEALSHEEADSNDPQDGGEGQENGAQGQEDGSEVRRQDGNEHREGLARPARRENDAFRTLRERAQAAERELETERLKARAFADQLAQFNNRPDPAAAMRAQQEEQERLAMMAPHEVAQYFTAKSEQRLAAQLQAMQRQQADALDKIAFGGIKRENPIAAKYEAEVERLVAQEAAKGVTVQRETALAFVIGQAVLKNAPAAAKKQQAAAAKRVAGATVARGGAAADVSAEPRGRAANDLAALERRLAGKFI